MDSLKQPAMLLSITNTVALSALVFYGFQKAKVYNDDFSLIKKDIEDLKTKSVESKLANERYTVLSDTVKSLDASSKAKTKKITIMSRDLANLQEDMKELAEIKSILEQVVKTMKNGGMEVKIQPPEEPQSIFRQKKKPQPQQKNRRNVEFDSTEDDEDEDMNGNELDDDDEVNNQVKNNRRR